MFCLRKARAGRGLASGACLDSSGGDCDCDCPFSEYLPGKWKISTISMFLPYMPQPVPSFLFSNPHLDIGIHFNLNLPSLPLELSLLKGKNARVCRLMHPDAIECFSHPPKARCYGSGSTMFTQTTLIRRYSELSETSVSRLHSKFLIMKQGGCLLAQSFGTGRSASVSSTRVPVYPAVPGFAGLHIECFTLSLV